MNYYCNPINVPYRYSIKTDPRDNYRLTVNREAADPSLVLFKGKYYLFASMSGSVWVSEDLVNWESVPLPENIPIYDYAPDIRVVGDWLYFTASNRGKQLRVPVNSCQALIWNGILIWRHSILVGFWKYP